MAFSVYFLIMEKQKQKQDMGTQNTRGRACHELADLLLKDALWTPSGHNVQPWRFEKTGPDKFNIHILDDGTVFHLDTNDPAILSGGMMLENIRLGAARYGKRIEWSILPSSNDKTPVICVEIHDGDAVQDAAGKDLYNNIRSRSTDRRAYRLRPLTNAEKEDLETILGDTARVHWIEPLSDRWKMSVLTKKSTDIRLRMEEAYPVHLEAIDWNEGDSETRIPVNALGINPLTKFIMHKVMKSWKRQHLMNKIPGSLLPLEIETDLWPGLSCGAHYIITSPEPLSDNLKERCLQIINLGCAVQKFWLKADQLGLALHPQHMPIIFGDYGRRKRPFAKDKNMTHMAEKFSTAFDKTLEKFGLYNPDQIIFMGRIGQPYEKKNLPRSTRLPVEKLMLHEENQETNKPIDEPDL